MARREATMTCERIHDLAAGYVLGALDASEMAAVRDHLGSCQLAHPDLEELGGVVPYLGLLVEPVEPPESLRSSILAAVEVEARGRRRSDEAAERLVSSFAGPTPQPIPASPAAPPAVATDAAARAAAAAPDAPTEPPAGPRAPRREPIPIGPARVRLRHALRVVLAAAAALAFVVGGVAVDRLYLGASLASQRPESGGILIEPGNRMAILTPAAGTSASGLASLQPGGHLIVDFVGLAATKGPQVYEVWLIQPGRAASPVGKFTVDKNGRGEVTFETNFVQGPTDVAISLEPSGFVPMPSGSMLLRGALEPRPSDSIVP